MRLPCHVQAMLVSNRESRSMQFHLNGFRAGDPAIAPPREAAPVLVDAVRAVDVLIVGCGPAGLTLAAQLAHFPEITTAIVEQKAGPLMIGQADGIACRSVEMFEAFGFSERVLKEACWVNETAFWNPDSARPEIIVRSRRIQDTEDDLSEMPHVILNQARVHDFFLEVMANSPTRLAPEYSRRLLGLDIAVGEDVESTSGYPVTVRLARLDDAQPGAVETLKARYVVGCDGARSSVREALGGVLHGDSANQAWGVMDVLAVSDFPDLRLKTVVHSATQGNVLIIPREGGYMVRMYIELDKLDAHERIASRKLDAAHLIAAAQRILHPYTLDVRQVAWWSVYEIGQRLCDRFDSASSMRGQAPHPRGFIVGDACHTHSPKAGQGMNVSMGDSFNLGWKLAAVLLGRCAPEVLLSYSDERRAVAQELIDFDREFARMFSARPAQAASTDHETVEPAAFQQYFIKHGRFTAGTAVHYAPSPITAASAHQALARDLTVGMRFHSAPVIRVADARPLQLGHVMKADGRWRLVLFADGAAPDATHSAMHALCAYLHDSAHSPVRLYTPTAADIDAVIDVRAVYQQAHRDIALEHLPALLLPHKGRLGLCDYEKVFCVDHKRGHDIFALRGIDRRQGCMVVVRPDQYVAQVLPLHAHGELAAFFAGFMRRGGV